jgi:hypothetical protein
VIVARPARSSERRLSARPQVKVNCAKWSLAVNDASRVRGYIRYTEAVEDMCSKLMAHIRSKWSGSDRSMSSGGVMPYACAIWPAVYLYSETRLRSSQSYAVALKLQWQDQSSATIAATKHDWVYIRPRGAQHKVFDNVVARYRDYTKRTV